MSHKRRLLFNAGFQYAVLAISVVTVVIGFSEIFVKQPTYLGVAAVIIGALAIYAHVFGVAWAYLPLAVQYVSAPSSKDAVRRLGTTESFS